MNENSPFIHDSAKADGELMDSVLEEFQEFNIGVAEQSSADDLYYYLCEHGSNLLNTYCKAGETSTLASGTTTEVTEPDHYLVHFSYPDRFKSIVLLIRDVLLQLSIAKLRDLEELVTAEMVTDHFEKSKALLVTELEKCLNYFKLERKSLLEKPEVLKRKLESVKHFSNPWKTYHLQFETIAGQFREIDQNYNRLEQTVIQYRLIREMVLQMKTDVQKINALFATKAAECLKGLEKISEKEQLSDTIKSFDDLITTGISQEIRPESTLRTLEDSVDKLQSLSVPVGSREGYLILRKIDFRKSAEKWLDYEILPYLSDLWDGQEANFSHLLNVATQIKSSLSVAKKTQQLVSFHGEITSLNSIIQQQKNTILQSEDLVSHIEKELSLKFKATEIYKEDEYLKVPLQNNFSLLATSKPGNLKYFSTQVAQLFKNVGKQVKDVKEKTPHQRLEIALEILETRNEKETPDHYHSLFLNKNFIGDLFLVKRKQQEEALEKIIDYWKKGQSRSLAVVGDPLSGKSTLLEFATHQFKSNEAHYLTPGGEISIEGRKLKVGRNLDEVFSFVKRSISNSKPILVLDDLQVWRDSNFSLLMNVKSLIDFMSLNSSKVFVIVGITNSLRLHLDTRIPFSQGFTNLLDTNASTSDEIFKAVMLRHGASHRSIFEKEGIEMNDGQLRKKIGWLTKKFDFNIGAVLQAWIFCTDVQQDGSIQFSEKETHLNDFLSISELLILKNCLLFGYSSDLELKNLFTDRYEAEYKPAIRKLLNIGVLDRDSNGYLIVKNTVRQDLYSILKYRELLA
ncbi:P-loop NTPase family protein [Algoriphagus antarcticus]|uniref:AAA+ ATPase domain-containing protein n=1 Tax=Algoriphagus antarcticus TaxID=238540 RepID=A0A3E0DMQ1_9BACT|nr:orc1/cdc6 family replication initiation protein [Algoriphagus antarcticus]REG83408.1 hypothetical protein C8N25_11853 [Algoriphagus antarcticus]